MQTNHSRWLHQEPLLLADGQTDTMKLQWLRLLLLSILFVYAIRLLMHLFTHTDTHTETCLNVFFLYCSFNNFYFTLDDDDKSVPVNEGYNNTTQHLIQSIFILLLLSILIFFPMAKSPFGNDHYCYYYYFSKSVYSCATHTKTHFQTSLKRKRGRFISIHFFLHFFLSFFLSFLFKLLFTLG